ncbi:MAG: hypothetical protein Q8L34_06240 [Candidatus Woesearchaeota archaeon]|nr:hypothetical protein [Candidatus Woesearchaeota archaeon]
MNKLFPHHNQRDRQKLVLFVIFFSFFIFLTFFYLLQQYNLISGAPTQGTVSLNVLSGGGFRPAAGEDTPTTREQGRLISLLLEVIPKKVELHLNQYDYSRFSLHLIHHADFPFDLTFTSNIPILKILEPYVALGSGEEQDVNFQVETDQVGTFIGHITIEDVFVFKQIPVLIQIDNLDFHVAVDLLTKTVLPGQDISAQIVVSPLFSQNLTLQYSVQDVTNKVYYMENEELVVTGGESRFQKTFSLPEPLPYNDYFLVVTAEQVDQKASGADSFAVVSSLTPTEEYPVQIYHQSPLLFFLIVLLILLVHLLIMWKRKK